MCSRSAVLVAVCFFSTPCFAQVNSLDGALPESPFMSEIQIPTGPQFPSQFVQSPVQGPAPPILQPNQTYSGPFQPTQPAASVATYSPPINSTALPRQRQLQ